MYARLAGRLADDPAPVAAVLGDDERWDAALRLFAAVHHLVLRGGAPRALSGDWDAFEAALVEHAAELARFVREQGVQTNEVQRCVGLLPCFLEVARRTALPLELLELGPSAGLNLLVDRYRYRYEAGAWGDPRAPLTLTAAEPRPVPAALLGVPLEVRRRRGIDLAPVDATSDDGLRLLRAFVWPGRSARVERLEAAVETLRRAEPAARPELVPGDYVELLPAVLASRPADAVTVVFQTASTGYVPAEGRRLLREALDEAGADGRPLAWVSTRAHADGDGAEGDGWALELRVWPAPEQVVARLDFHGNWLEWLA